ncbi:hypothetical protein CYMTET_4252 [Cymbomonas tetramitiformis]|uniref:F-box domain-containing protein n=1 Tax=Cymbomonas tetramitiformis TaxID=36881 RepID=A0AAE0H1J1_9CHLO|nr:hypothetical protein CYMTET_4252 [Cymbomonas tetramitiformis]
MTDLETKLKRLEQLTNDLHKGKTPSRSDNSKASAAVPAPKLTKQTPATRSSGYAARGARSATRGVESSVRTDKTLDDNVASVLAASEQHRKQSVRSTSLRGAAPPSTSARQARDGKQSGDSASSASRSSSAKLNSQDASTGTCAAPVSVRMPVDISAALSSRPKELSKGSTHSTDKAVPSRNVASGSNQGPPRSSVRPSTASRVVATAGGAAPGSMPFVTQQGMSAPMWQSSAGPVRGKRPSSAPRRTRPSSAAGSQGAAEPAGPGPGAGSSAWARSTTGRGSGDHAAGALRTHSSEVAVAAAAQKHVLDLRVEAVGLGLTIGPVASAPPSEEAERRSSTARPVSAQHASGGQSGAFRARPLSAGVRNPSKGAPGPPGAAIEKTIRGPRTPTGRGGGWALEERQEYVPERGQSRREPARPGLHGGASGRPAGSAASTRSVVCAAQVPVEGEASSLLMAQERDEALRSCPLRASSPSSGASGVASQRGASSSAASKAPRPRSAPSRRAAATAAAARASAAALEAAEAAEAAEAMVQAAAAAEAAERQRINSGVATTVQPSTSRLRPSSSSSASGSNPTSACIRGMRPRSAHPKARGVQWEDGGDVHDASFVIGEGAVGMDEEERLRVLREVQADVSGDDEDEEDVLGAVDKEDGAAIRDDQEPEGRQEASCKISRRDEEESAGGYMPESSSRPEEEPLGYAFPVSSRRGEEELSGGYMPESSSRSRRGAAGVRIPSVIEKWRGGVGRGLHAGELEPSQRGDAGVRIPSVIQTCVIETGEEKSAGYMPESSKATSRSGEEESAGGYLPESWGIHAVGSRWGTANEEPHDEKLTSGAEGMRSGPGCSTSGIPRQPSKAGDTQAPVFLDTVADGDMAVGRSESSEGDLPSGRHSTPLRRSRETHPRQTWHTSGLGLDLISEMELFDSRPSSPCVPSPAPSAALVGSAEPLNADVAKTNCSAEAASNAAWSCDVELSCTSAERATSVCEQPSATPQEWGGAADPRLQGDDEGSQTEEAAGHARVAIYHAAEVASTSEVGDEESSRHMGSSEDESETQLQPDFESARQSFSELERKLQMLERLTAGPGRSGGVAQPASAGRGEPTGPRGARRPLSAGPAVPSGSHAKGEAAEAVSGYDTWRTPSGIKGINPAGQAARRVSGTSVATDTRHHHIEPSEDTRAARGRGKPPPARGWQGAGLKSRMMGRLEKYSPAQDAAATKLPRLPRDMLAKILQLLSFSSLRAAESSCSELRQTVVERELWRATCLTAAQGMPDVLRAGIHNKLANGDMGQLSALYKRLRWLLAQRPSSRSVVSEALSASSTDHPEEALANVLVRRTRATTTSPPCYWSSSGSPSPKMTDRLLFRLCAPLCLVHEVQLRVFQAYFQRGRPIFSPLKVRFRIGCVSTGWRQDGMSKDPGKEALGGTVVEEGEEWVWSSPPKDVRQVETMQRFPLNKPVICAGGFFQVELLGRAAMQHVDQQYFVCLQHVRVVGRPLPGFHVAGDRVSLRLVSKLGTAMNLPLPLRLPRQKVQPSGVVVPMHIDSDSESSEDEAPFSEAALLGEIDDEIDDDEEDMWYPPLVPIP